LPAARALKSGARLSKPTQPSVSRKVTIVTRNRGTYQLKRSVAARKVRHESLTYRWLDNFTVIEIDSLPARPLGVLFWDGLLGTGNLHPFAKVQNPMRKPDSVNYPIPAVGAHTRTVYCENSILYREALTEMRASLSA